MIAKGGPQVALVSRIYEEQLRHEGQQRWRGMRCITKDRPRYREDRYHTGCAAQPWKSGPSELALSLAEGAT